MVEFNQKQRRSKQINKIVCALLDVITNIEYYAKFLVRDSTPPSVFGLAAFCFWPAETEMAGGDMGLGHLIGLHKGRG